MHVSYRTLLKKVLLNCTFGNALETCPAREIRELPIYERLTMVDAMSDEEVKSILEYHRKCLDERQALNI
jgi:hypothetical protein